MSERDISRVTAGDAEQFRPDLQALWRAVELGEGQARAPWEELQRIAARFGDPPREERHGQ